MNCSISSSLFVMFLVFLLNPCFSSGHVTKLGDGDTLLSSTLLDEKNGDFVEKLMMKDDEPTRQDEQGRPGGRRNTKASSEPETDSGEKTENGRRFPGKLDDRRGDYLAEADHGLAQRHETLRLNENGNAINRKSRNKSGRSHRRRHNKKLQEEIESVQDELNHVVTNLDDMAKKETELQQEIDELQELQDNRQLKAAHGHDHDIDSKQRSEIENVKRPNPLSKSGRMFPDPEEEGVIGMSELLEERVDFLENEDQDLGDRDVKSGRKLSEEVKHLRQKIGKVQSRNRELREKNKELRRQLCEPMVQQSSMISETLSAVSGKTRESLEGETLVHRCEKFFREQELKKRVKPHPRKDEDIIEDLHHAIREDQNVQGEDTSIEDEQDLEHPAGTEEEKGKHTEYDNEGKSSVNTVSYDFETERNSEVEADVEFPEEEENVTISMDHEDKMKVYDHIVSVDAAISCDQPRPVVIYPSDDYPVPNKFYSPQGTILHRCGKHSGCCPNERLTCVPSKKERVALYFFAAVLDGSTPVVPHVEKLLFTNHTKCCCVYKTDAHNYL